MGKIDFEFSSKSSERTVGCIEKGICGAIIYRSEPFALEYPPQCFRDIQMRAVWRQEKEEHATLLPDRPKLPHEFASVDASIVKNHESVLAYMERKPVKEVSNLVGGHVLGGNPSYRLFRSIKPKILSLNHLSDGILTSSPRNCHPYGTYPSVQMWLSSP